MGMVDALEKVYDDLEQIVIDADDCGRSAVFHKGSEALYSLDSAIRAAQQYDRGELK
jgi:hypothetical protein